MEKKYLLKSMADVAGISVAEEYGKPRFWRRNKPSIEFYIVPGFKKYILKIQAAISGKKLYLSSGIKDCVILEVS
ncbi:MAG: hypothetical protein Q8N80_06490 [Candidatus Omnitrophota bacterium]|nr:hypothetical protein [Candidatus Omnitrophota bacterium]